MTFRKFHGAALVAAFALASATGFTYSTPNDANLPKGLTLESFVFAYSGNGSGSTENPEYTHGYSGEIPAGFPGKDGGDKDLPSWTRVDSVVPLAYLASPAVGQLGNLRASFPPGIDLHYSADLEAAFTIQNFDPAIYGGQAFHGSPKFLTPYTTRWLIQNGWGLVLERYEQKHHVHVTPESDRQAFGANPYDLPSHETTVTGWHLQRGTVVAKDTWDVGLTESSKQYTGALGLDLSLAGHVTWATQPPAAWIRPDSVALLKDLDSQMPYWVHVAMPANIGLTYGPDLAAAMAIQNFNPGSIGCQPLAPSPKTLTKTTVAWLVKNGWGAQLARYEIVHGLRRALRGE